QAELVGRIDVELLVGGVAECQVEVLAAAVGKRLHDFFERRVIRAARVIRKREPDGRQHLARRRDRPLNHLSAWPLTREDGLRRERQRKPDAESDRYKTATVYHAANRIPCLWSEQR